MHVSIVLKYEQLALMDNDVRIGKGQGGHDSHVYRRQSGLLLSRGFCVQPGNNETTTLPMFIPFPILMLTQIIFIAQLCVLSYLYRSYLCFNYCSEWEGEGPLSPIMRFG